MLAAHLRDDAEAARVIAALGDFHVGGVRRREAKARRVVVGNIDGLARDEIQRLPGCRPCGSRAARARCSMIAPSSRDLVEPDEGIDFRHFAREFLGETAAPCSR